MVEFTGEDGVKSKVLFKKNDDARPPLARTIAYITMPEPAGYTIEADVMGIESAKSCRTLARRQSLHVLPR